MRINSNRKGKVGERELANKFKDYGYHDVRRGQQFKGTEDSADLEGIPGIHPECKREKNLQLLNAMEKVTSECGVENLPAVFHRENHKDWKVTMWKQDFDNIFSAWCRGHNREFDYNAITACTVVSPVLRLDDWLGRAKLCAGDGNAKPALIYNRPDSKETITLYLDDWIEFYREWEAGISSSAAEG